MTTAAQRQLGQFFTARAVADLIAAQPRLDQLSRLRVLDPTLENCRLAAASALTYETIPADFIPWAAGRTGQFDLVIQNPPYAKLGRGVPARHLDPLGIDVPNFYAAFIALSARLLTDGGQLVAITPAQLLHGP